MNDNHNAELLAHIRQEGDVCGHQLTREERQAASTLCRTTGKVISRRVAGCRHRHFIAAD